MKAYTLVEVLLYISLVSVVLMMIMAFMNMMESARARNEVVSEVDQQGSQILDILLSEIEKSEVMTVPAMSQTSTQLVLDDGGSTISVDLNGSNIEVTDGDTYQLNNNNVQVSNLSFVNLSPTPTNQNIQIQFDLSYLSSNNRSEYDYTQTYRTSTTIK